MSKYSYDFTNRVNLGNLEFWDPWTGCVKVSEACKHCYYCPSFERFTVGGPNAILSGSLPFGTVIVTAFKSDFFIDQADFFRIDAWEVIRRNPEYIFLICTKRVERILDCLPSDWGEGYDNVVFMVTAENQKRVDERLPILINLPCKHKWVAATPLLEPINLEPYLNQGIEHVQVGGERTFGREARPLDYDWVLNLADQCKRTNTRMSFVSVGSNFKVNDSVLTGEGTACYHSKVADSLETDVVVPLKFNLNNKEFILE